MPRLFGSSLRQQSARSGPRAWFCSRRLRDVKRPPDRSKYLTLAPSPPSDRDHTTDCVTCHIDDNYGQYTCYACREHSRSKIREEHVGEGFLNYEACVECHRGGDKDEAEELWRSGSGKSAEGGFDSRRQDSSEGEQREHEND